MPFIDDFWRAQAMPEMGSPTSDPVAAARRARAAALAAWMAAVWRMLAGSAARAKDPARWPGETKIKNREDLPMRRRRYEAYAVPHQID
jgi:hypothetical protein